MKAMRRNVLVDCGKTENQLGAKLIETPDQYKRIPNKGVIVSIGPECRLMDESLIGKTCILKNHRHDEDRIKPHIAEKLGLKPHWYFNIHEDTIECVID